MKIILTIMLFITLSASIDALCDSYKCNLFCNEQYSNECGITVRNGYLNYDCPIGNCHMNDFCKCYLYGRVIN